MNRKALSVLLSLMLVAMVGLVVNCGGDTEDTPAAPAVAKRTMASDFRSNADYHFIHGTNNPDGDKLYVSLNETEAGGGGVGSKMTKKFTAYMLKMSDVTAGKVTSASVLATSAQIDAATAFRQSFTPDGTKIVQAGKDRVVVLKASDLSTLSSNTNVGGGSKTFENHDALTLDDEYALLALQSRATATTDTVVAKVVLFNITTGQAIGAAANICAPCHDSVAAGGTGGAAKNHAMCGIDAKLTKTAAGKFSGKLYSSSTGGGHIVEANITIDASNTTTPVTVSSASQLAQISNAVGAGTDIPNFHDVRLDTANNRVYYSAIAVDKGANAGRTHMGYVDLADKSVHDATISATTEAQAQIVYCGSGQTKDFFIPQTMSYPAYIDAVPKALLKKGAAINP